MTPTWYVFDCYVYVYSMKIETIFSQNRGFFLDTSREIHIDM